MKTSRQESGVAKSRRQLSTVIYSHRACFRVTGV
jgi:hypothetical protein